MALFLKFAYQPILKTKPEQTNKVTTALSLFHRAQNYGHTKVSFLQHSEPLTNGDRWGLCPAAALTPLSHLIPQPPIREGGGSKSTVPAGRTCSRWII